ncbi:winged helix-turn-helix domain-containing protein [Dyella terrae]|uniref:winged helix-turn-helix domain-containing protein n=1 Tax=Dyella terrae TaxID=522259 RepID=UPI0023D96240|nr:crosslink repair DNA glycosylase YcaQ family protein [Dyella terrae]ULU27598.1 winged helix DNA-binding domain-containing protein [Dyella terrae]
MKASLPLSVASSALSASLSLAQAQRLHLAAQGVLNKPKARAKKADVVDTVARMRLLQIDSIHVVARSPYLVLYSRLGDYDPQWLEGVLEDGRIAESWAHEACFVPAADLPLHQAWRTQRAMHWAYKHADRMHREHREGMDALLTRIRDNGAARAADFESETRSAGGWWSWKPEKRWLEAWFALGELMVTRRERFQRVYDLAERVLEKLEPPMDPALLALDHEALRRRFILDSVRALGVTQARWVADYYRLKPAVTDKELAPWVGSGELLMVQVADWNVPAYVHRDNEALLAQAASGQLRPTHTTLLSPFDPIVWDRARAQILFGFEYTIECYVPAPKRRYGYYVLPILHRGRLIGRLDAKAHRREGVFEVKALFLEPDVEATPRLLEDVAGAIRASAQWHGTPKVKLARSRPTSVAPALRALLR